VWRWSCHLDERTDRRVSGQGGMLAVSRLFGGFMWLVAQVRVPMEVTVETSAGLEGEQGSVNRRNALSL